MDWVLKHLKMVIPIQDNGRTANFMGKDYIQIIFMDKHLKENGMKGTFLEGLCYIAKGLKE